jgi:hypothetical protein
MSSMVRVDALETDNSASPLAVPWAVATSP